MFLRLWNQVILTILLTWFLVDIQKTKGRRNGLPIQISALSRQLIIWDRMVTIWRLRLMSLNAVHTPTVVLKGQLLSNMTFWYLQFSQKTNKKFDITKYYGTSSRIVSVRFFGDLKTQKRHSEINWPLILSQKSHKMSQCFRRQH